MNHPPFPAAWPLFQPPPPEASVGRVRAGAAPPRGRGRTLEPLQEATRRGSGTRRPQGSGDRGVHPLSAGDDPGVPERSGLARA